MREPRTMSSTPSRAATSREPRARARNRLSRLAATLGAALPVALAVTLGAVAPVAAEPVFHWENLYDGGGQSPDQGTAVLCDSQGNVVVGGESYDGVDGSDMFVRKLARDSGETIWTRRVSAFDGNDMTLSGMVWDDEENILVGGHINGCVG